MDQHRIKELIDLIGASDLTELHLSEGGCTLQLSRQGSISVAAAPQAQAKPQTQAQAPAVQNPTPAAPPTETKQAEQSSEVRSPLYGVLHLTPSPDEPAFVQIGDTVSAGQTLCIVEAMKMFHQVSAPVAGTVEAVLGQAGSEVESGQPLFRIAKAG